ncbi:hypothetical protein WJX81_007207 [Elliptochloris bilobata]|uniref:Uncharacterized protein n=1 Tax=Elliptochloris bilobata TaxID=381761 RepID=A0AAW1QIS6_9CHLO
MRAQLEQGTVPANEHYQAFWSRYKTSRPEHMSGWVGKFVSYGVDGAAEADVRFQDTWLRLFQERGPSGKYVMKMIRKADQAAKSWPRAGKQREADGYDETVLEGERADSVEDAGFEHPYGRGGVPPARVIALSLDALAQVTLQLPSEEEGSSKQEYDFMGGSELTLFHSGMRLTLTVAYRAGGGGAMLFHQTGWDPVFVEDVDPDKAFDIDALLEEKVQPDRSGTTPGPALPADTAEWLHGNWQGEAMQLAFDAGGRCWMRGAPAPVSWTPPVEVAGSTLYRYPGGMYAMYPAKLPAGGASLELEAGAVLGNDLLRRYRVAALNVVIAPKVEGLVLAYTVLAILTFVELFKVNLVKVPSYGRDATKGLATALSMSFSMPPNLVLFLWMLLTKRGNFKGFKKQLFGYGVVTCYSMQMFVFLVFVGMVLSGSYPLVRSWEALEVNWTPAKTQHFRACYLMAWLLAGCFQVTFLFLLLGKSLLSRLFAEPMLLDEPLPDEPAKDAQVALAVSPAKPAVQPVPDRTR